MKKLFLILLILGLCGSLFAQHTEVTVEDNQSVTGNKTFTGTTAFTGPVTLNPSKVNGTIFLDGSTYPVSGSAQTTTGSINSGSSVLTLSSALDFKNGQGILIAGAGATPSVSTPTGCAVTQTGSAGGASYSYHIAEMDAQGGITAAAAATTSTGNASLSASNFNVITCNADASRPRAYIVWGRTSGSEVFLGYAYANVAGGVATAVLNDTGGTLPGVTRPAFVPNAFPASAQNEFLITKISSGAGSTSLNLTATASATVSSQFVQHDDSSAIASAFAAASALGGTRIKFPVGTYNVNAQQNSPPGNKAILYFTGLNNVDIQGDGGNSVIQVLMPNITALTIQDSTNVIVEDLKIVLPNTGYNIETATINPKTGLIDYGANVGGANIQLSNVTYGIIRRNELQGGSVGGIYVNAGTSHSIIENNYIHDKSGPALEQDACAEGNSFTSCAPTVAPVGNVWKYNRIVKASGGDYAVISTDDGGTQGRTQIVGNIVIGGTGNAWDHCISAGNAGALEIVQNYCLNIENDNIIVLLSLASASVSDIDIMGNIINNTGGGVNTISSGIVLFNNAANGAVAKDVSVINNSVSGATGYGVRMQCDATAYVNVSITGNTAYNNSLGLANAYDGFFLKGTNINFTGNSSSGNSNQRYGFNVDPASAIVTGAGNMITGNASAPFLDSGNVSGINYSTTTGGTLWTGLTMQVPVKLIQSSTGFVGGKSACVTNTKAISFAVNFTSTPVILVFDETTKGGANLTASSNSGFTVSCTGATDAFDWMVLGNPN